MIHEYYSTLSPLKNKMFNDAEDGNGDEYIRHWLDPMAQTFIDDVKAARGELTEEALQGETYYATEALPIGLIDGEYSMEETVEYIQKLIKPSSSININELEL